MQTLGITLSDGQTFDPNLDAANQESVLSIQLSDELAKLLNINLTDLLKDFDKE